MAQNNKEFKEESKEILKLLDGLDNDINLLRANINNLREFLKKEPTLNQAKNNPEIVEIDKGLKYISINI